MGNVKNILLTGKPGVGKTTVLTSMLRLLNVSVGGFYTKESREKGERTGFDIISLSGESCMLARKGLKSGYHVGSYGVDVEAIDRLAVRSIMEAMVNKDIIVIDEIGKMELFSDLFKDATRRALDSETPVLGVIMEKGNEFANAVKARDDVEVIEVTRSNRDRLPAALKEKIERIKQRHLTYQRSFHP